MDIKRREFLVRSIAGVGGLLLGSQLTIAKQKSKTFNPYEIVPLGKIKINVSRVGFGTGMRGGRGQSNQTRLGKEKFEALLQAAYERGVRLFDCADSYGSHPYVARALKKMPRKDYIIVTKIQRHWWGMPEEEVDAAVERFLRELDTDYIDVVLLHCVISAKWPQEFQKQMEILAKLKKKGIIRAHGVSCHSLKALEAAANEPWVDSVHARINAYGIAMDGQPEQIAPVLKKIHNAGVGVAGMKLIGEGQFRDNAEKRDKSIQYVLGLGCVDTMIVGFEKVEEIDDFAARVRKVILSVEEVRPS